MTYCTRISAPTTRAAACSRWRSLGHFKHCKQSKRAKAAKEQQGQKSFFRHAIDVFPLSLVQLHICAMHLVTVVALCAAGALAMQTWFRAKMRMAKRSRNAAKAFAPCSDTKAPHVDVGQCIGRVRIPLLRRFTRTPLAACGFEAQECPLINQAHYRSCLSQLKASDKTNSMHLHSVFSLLSFAQLCSALLSFAPLCSLLPRLRLEVINHRSSWRRIICKSCSRCMLALSCSNTCCRASAMT